jgi:hypothetical protein
MFEALGSIPRITKTKQKPGDACNPSYSGGRDQADHILKPAGVNQDPILKKTQKMAGGVAESISLEFKPQYC